MAFPDAQMEADRLASILGGGSVTGTGGTGDFSIEDLAAILAQLGLGGSSTQGFAPPAFSGTEAGLKLQGQLGIDQLQLGSQLNIKELQERAKLEEAMSIKLETLRQKGALSLQERAEVFALETQLRAFKQETQVIQQQAGISTRLEELRQKGALTLQERNEVFALETQLRAFGQESKILKTQEGITTRLEELRQKGALTLQERNEVFALETQLRAFTQESTILKQQEGVSSRLEQLRQRGALSLQENQQKFELEQQLKELEQERQIVIAQTLGQDPVRAVLMSQGIGGQLVPGGERFAGLGPVKGAQEFTERTETALSGLVGGRDISIGERGVTGLPSIENVASTFQLGSGGGRTLLSSAFGVGNLDTGGGLSTEAIQRRVQDVTPTGAL